MNRPTTKHTTHSRQRWLALWGVCCAALAATAQTSVEYFWDMDPGYGQGTVVSYTAEGETTEVAFDVSTATLTAGVHRLGIRTLNKRDDGTLYYSPTYFKYVVKDVVPEHTEIEYFWNEDPGMGKGYRVGYTAGGEMCDATFTASMAELANGLHRLGLRTVTTAGGREYCSPTLWNYVLKTKDVSADVVEYFWDEDPGYGKATQVAVTTGDDATTVTFDVSVEGLSEGVHRLCFRSSAGEGWSPTVQYYVRVVSGEPQLITAIEYYWDVDPGFGKATPIPFTPATMVDLSGYEFDVDGLMGDHYLYIRAQSKGGWSPFVTQLVVCSAEGNFTLNEQLAEGTERNYRSLAEMFGDFALRHATNDITVTVRGGATFGYDATTADALNVLTAVAEDLEKYDARITFEAPSAATLNITANEADMAAVIALCARISLKNVTLNINGTAYDFSVVGDDQEELCSGSESGARMWSGINSAITASWTATATGNKDVKGYTASGTGDLPAMTLTNTGAARDYVIYTVSLAYGETEVYSFTHVIYVNPAIAAKKVSFTSPTPADGAIINPGTVTVKWNAVGGATSYEVTVERTADADGTVETTTTEQTATSIKITAESGYSYIYKVRAIGPCDATAESSRGFTMFRADADDLAALRVLYDACGGTGWSKQWLVDAEVLASTNYPGVTFSPEGRVTAINLAGYGLTGELPGEGFSLPELTTLTLNNNSIIGLTAGADLPKLVTLNLAGNRVAGLTAGLSLPELTTLDLSSNHVSELLISGFSLPKLATLNLSNNQLEGELPTEALDLPALTTLNLSRNSLTGNVPASLLKECTLLRSLDLSHNQLTEVKTALPASITSLNLNNQHRVYGSNNKLHDLTELGEVEIGLKSTLEAAFGQNSLMEYSHSGKSYATFDLYDVALKEQYARLTYTQGYYHLAFLNADYKQPQDAELMMVAISGYANGSVQPVVVSYVEADANVDRLVDVLDVQHSLNYVVADKGAEGLFNWSAANTFADDLINIQDIVVTVNHVLDHTNATAQARARRMSAAARAKAHGHLYVEDGFLCLAADTAVAALDIELQGAAASQVRLMLLGSDWQMISRATDEGVRLVIFSPTGKTLPVGITKLLALRADKANPIAVEAADAKARALTIAVEGGDATGLDAAELTEALTARIQDGVLYVESTMECEGVTLTLYAPAGRQLIQYADESLQAGENMWHIGSDAQGVYLLQVRMANGSTYVMRIAGK